MHNVPLRASVLAVVASLATGCDDDSASPSFDSSPIALRSAPVPPIGQEVAVPVHLEDGEEQEVSVLELVAHGARLFNANWTSQEGAGRPLTDGTGGPLSDPSSPLVFPHNFNRVSGPDANSCAGCHNLPRSGGGGDNVGNVFVLANRFDFATFDPTDLIGVRGGVDELGNPVTLQSIANERNTLGMFGSGYIEMLARQITEDLQAIRDDLDPGDSSVLVSKGITYGTLSRNLDGSWDTTAVEGLRPDALASSGPADPPSLIIAPFHQAGAVVSLRQFSVNAFNQHHGIQATERFGQGTDPDGDGFTDEMTVADVTAVSIWQATLPVPGQVIPDDDVIEAAIVHGEELFADLGCSDCHVPALPLDAGAWSFVEPNPFNPPGNLQPGDADPVVVDLNDDDLPPPRLDEEDGVVWVPAFTDLKLHDITSGPGSPDREPLDMQFPAGSPEFFAGNSHFLTRKLWGVANEPPYFHHGKHTTLRQAVLAHSGEALASRQDFEALDDYGRDCVIEFLKSLQVLPAGTKWREVDEDGHKKPKHWRNAYLD
ncbi:MAG: thiol oxidoreductase [Myxococcales bacterium]|nr:thiol oxidoreductase [Myxococcales bacterium]MCB9712238.1 thiol oxidoreductase [Myxococcales bacterium]